MSNHHIIYKYKIDFGPSEHIIPVDHQVVHFGFDPKIKAMAAWISHALPEENAPMMVAKFWIIGTGMAYDTSVWQHAGTAIQDLFVWHLLTEKTTQSGKASFTERVETHVGSTAQQ